LKYNLKGQLNDQEKIKYWICRWNDKK